MLYSVIIPCYNVAQYLRRTLDSILCQDTNDYEIILVNDGSQDNTLNIIIEYAAKYDCVKYINQSNQGVSIARNAGIKIAEGTYLAFVDADDTINSNYFETLNEYIVNNPDIIFFGFKHFLNEQKVTDVHIKSDSDRILFDLLTYRTKCNLWNGIYRTSLIQKNNIWFDENTYYNEDREFFINAIISTTSEKICIVKELLYNYLFNPTSVMRLDKYSTKRFTAILASERIYNIILRKHGENSHITKAAYNFLIHNLITHKIRIIKSGEYTIFKDLFIPYNKLVLSIPPYVASVFYFYNIFNIIFNRTTLAK